MKIYIEHAHVFGMVEKCIFPLHLFAFGRHRLVHVIDPVIDHTTRELGVSGDLTVNAALDH